MRRPAWGPRDEHGKTWRSSAGAHRAGGTGPSTSSGSGSVYYGRQLLLAWKCLCVFPPATAGFSNLFPHIWSPKPETGLMRDKKIARWSGVPRPPIVRSRRDLFNWRLKWRWNELPDFPRFAKALLHRDATTPLYVAISNFLPLGHFSAFATCSCNTQW